MSMLTREFNYMRKAQRVDIPLLVRVAGKVYKTANWSMTGLGVMDYDGDISPGDTIEMKLVLPIVSASLHIDVQAVCRNIRGGITGFEFNELSSRHKRVLRHYIELSLEGKLDRIEDLLSDFTAPDIETPIKEALNITEEEQVSLLRKFRSRAFLTVFAGFLLMGYILFTLVYNMIFVYETVGVAAGNLVQITAGTSGFLKKHHVKVGDEVHAGAILFDLDDSKFSEELRKNDERLEQQKKLLEQLSQSVGVSGSSKLLSLLRDDFARKEQDLQNAVRLYREQVISVKDYKYIENEYHRAQINFIREQELQSNDQRTLTERKETIEKKIDFLAGERQRLLKDLENVRIKSPITGVVFTISYFTGEFLTNTDVVVTLATNENPFILFKMPSKESGKAQLGMKARVYSFETGKTYEGTISSIGYSAINPRSTLLQEVSLEQTVIKVDLFGNDVDIPINSRVDVWVSKQVPSVQKLIDWFNIQAGGSDA